jgi:hypothetical protein
MRLLRQGKPFHDVGVAHDLVRRAVGDLRPETSTARRCENVITAFMMCSIMMTVTPSPFSRSSNVNDVVDLGVRLRPAIDFVCDQQLGVGRHGTGKFELAHLDLCQARAAASPPLSAKADLARSSMTACFDCCQR